MFIVIIAIISRGEIDSAGFSERIPAVFHSQADGRPLREVPIIDDAHLMPGDCLRKLRLLCEDFPRSHNHALIGQPQLMQSLSLTIHEEIRSRITSSVVLPRLAPEDIEKFLLDQFDQFDQFDRAGLGHNTSPRSPRSRHPFRPRHPAAHPQPLPQLVDRSGP
ncbi:MAG: hypothetical protein ACI9OD_005143 [Limisphaerales bacterium]|jgi:hypothetical protein